MPSPIGHALGGAIAGVMLTWPPPTTALAKGLAARCRAAIGSRALAAAAAAACLPDLDFLWGRHNMETHSLGAAVIAGVLVAVASRGRARRLALAVAVAWSSHVLFDWLGSDDTPPLGVMALWPLSSEFYFGDVFLFDAISRRYWLPGFAAHNLWAVIKELAVLVPVLVGLVLFRCRRPGSVGHTDVQDSTEAEG